jgi:hypothetical protein
LHLGFRNVDDHIAQLRTRNRQDGLARRDDLAHFGRRGGNDPVKFGFQLRISELLFGLGQIGLRFGNGGARSLLGLLRTFEGRLAA